MDEYIEEYDYVMRLDDDSFIEEPLIDDLFKICKDSDANYMSNIVHIDCGICNYGMKELFTQIFPDKKENIDKLFINADLKNNLEVYVFSIISISLNSLINRIKTRAPNPHAMMSKKDIEKTSVVFFSFTMANPY